jgi:hypothetical protein
MRCWPGRDEACRYVGLAKPGSWHPSGHSGPSGRSGREVEGALRRRLLPPALAAHAIHTLSESAFLKEALCLARELPV